MASVELSLKKEEPKASNEAPSFREQYAANLKQLAALHDQHCPLPRVSVRYTNLSYTLHLKQSQVDRKIRTVGTAIKDLALVPWTLANKIKDAAMGTNSGTQPLHILNDIDGVIPAGTMTLLLTPPGGGKTNFLRAIAGRLPESSLKGRITYNQQDKKEALAQSGVYLSQLATYCDQLDVHLPLLTVRETFQFINDNGTADPALLPTPELQEAANRRVEDTIKLLSLGNAANTIVGNDVIRGTSGGEKKRVTIGESIVGNHRLLALDEISTGLDASVTFDICASISRWCKVTGGTAVIALLQPTPEVYALFDSLILMRDGAVIYHGPRENVGPYFRGLGYHPPAEDAALRRAASNRSDGLAGGGAGEAEGDLADWLTSTLTHPSHSYLQGLEKAGLRTEIVSTPAGAASPTGTSTAAALAGGPPVTTEALVATWKASPQYREMMAGGAAGFNSTNESPALPAPPTAVISDSAAVSVKAPATSTSPLDLVGFDLSTPWLKAQYGSPYPRSFGYHFGALLRRQWTLTYRNKLFVTFRIVSAIILALILGSVFWQLSPSVADGFSKFGLFLFGAMQVSFANFSEVPLMVENKYTVYKHLASGAHPSSAYVWSVFLLSIPIAFLEAMVFAAILYPMTGLVMEAGRFFFFFLLLWVTDLAMGAFFRIFAFASPDMETAQVAPGPIISIQMLFAGFLITREEMGWLQFMNYISIFGYVLRAMGINEFNAAEYKQEVTIQVPLTNFTVTTTNGDLLMGLLGLQDQNNMGWKWGAVGFCIGFGLLMTLIGGIILAFVRIERNVGTAREKTTDAPAGGAGAVGGKTVDGEQPASSPTAYQIETFGAAVEGAVASAAIPMIPASAVTSPSTNTANTTSRPQLSVASSKMVHSSVGDFPLSPVSPNPDVDGTATAYPDGEAAPAGEAAASASAPVVATTAVENPPAVVATADAAAASSPSRAAYDAIAVSVSGSPDHHHGKSASALGEVNLALSLPSPLPTSGAPEASPTHAEKVIPASMQTIASAASVLPFQPVSLAFRDIRYSVPIAKRTELDSITKEKKTIPGYNKTLLQGVSGFALPGTITALMGASGAGKTTLLDVICGRKNSGIMSGEILINGFPKDQKAFARMAGYVEQQDLHNAYSTVREALEFSAFLRLPSNVTAAQREAFVNEIMEVLELDAIADRKIGEAGAADGLSPGQRKLLTIGVELVANPPILALDEPTSGLDSRAAAIVARVMRRIADRGRTIITTVHQPASEVFLQFDNLLLLQRGGWQVYMGPIGRHQHGRDLVRYMESIPGTQRCPKGMNAASWMLDVLAGTDSSGIHRKASQVGGRSRTGSTALPGSAPGTSRSRAGSAVHPEAFSAVPKSLAGTASIPEGGIVPGRAGPNDVSPGEVDYQAIFFASSVWAKEKQTLDAACTPQPGTSPLKVDSVYARGFIPQTSILIKRGAVSYWRNESYNWVRVMTLIGLNILFGVIYYNINSKNGTPSGVQSMVSVVFMSAAFIGLLNMNTLMPVLIKERPVFYREKMSYLYSPTAYGISCIVNEIPYIIAMCLTAVPIIYFMCGFPADAGTFFFYDLICFVFITTFVSIAMFVSAIMPNIQVAQAVVGLIIPILFLFGGLFLRPPQIPRGWKWLNIIDPITYSLAALITPLFACPTIDSNPSACPQIIYIDQSNAASQTAQMTYVETQFGLEYSNRWRDFGILCAYIGIFQILHFIAVNYVSHIKR